MTERRRTKAEKKSYALLLQELTELETWWEAYKLKDPPDPERLAQAG
jgi:hypothetical protein